MAERSGFFNSINGDIKYSADDFNSLLDGLVTNGVIKGYGAEFKVSIKDSSYYNMGEGIMVLDGHWYKAGTSRWSRSSYSKATASDDKFYEAIYINFDSNKREMRMARIYGDVSKSSPTKPTLPSNSLPIAWILRTGTGVEVSTITNCVGTSECPYLSTPVSTVSEDELLSLWDGYIKRGYEDLHNILEFTHNGSQGAKCFGYSSSTSLNHDTDNDGISVGSNDLHYNLINSKTDIRVKYSDGERQYNYIGENSKDKRWECIAPNSFSDNSQSNNTVRYSIYIYDKKSRILHYHTSNRRY